MQYKPKSKMMDGPKTLYQKHKDNMKNIQPTVDDKPPVLNPVLLYNTGFMENNAARQMQIDEENFKLLQRINIIYRTKGKTDCYNPETLDPHQKYVMRLKEQTNRQLFKENTDLLTNIRNVTTKTPTRAQLKIHQKKNYDSLMFKSKFPEYLKERIYLRDYYDPLIVNAGLPRDVRIKKSKCFLDIVDSTADRPLGRLTVEVYDSIVPKTADNFLALCNRRGQGGYNGTEFFHIVPGLFCLGGDVQCSVGLGGTSAVTHNGRRYFADENYTLSHNAPGVLAMYNLDRNTNASQFLMTFKPLTTMDGRYVVFGRVVSGFNTLAWIEKTGLPSGKPKRKVVISNCGTV